MATSRHGKSKGRCGFTLIELAVVLFIISLLIWTVLPKISIVAKEGIEEFTRKTALHIETTMEEALFESKGGKITVRIGDGIIEGYRSNEEGDLLKNWSLTLPETHTIASVTTNFGKRYTADDVDIPYSPMGALPRTLIIIEEKEGTSAQTILINQFTGKVEISDGIATEKI